MSKLKMISFVISVSLALWLVFFSGQGQAHGVRGMVNMSEAFCAAASYDDGEPMSYAGVEVIAPESTLPFQSGRTDRNGFFCFRPDRAGQWQLSVRDEMGHRVCLQTIVSSDLALVPDQDRQEYDGLFTGKVGGVITGIGLIFGLSGFWTFWLSRKL